MRTRITLFFVQVIVLVLVIASYADAYDLPEYKTNTLCTGAKVYSYKTSELPMIHFRITFDVGTNQEEVGSEGTIDVLKEWMDEGTKDLDRQALAEKLNALGIQLSFQSGFETITFSMNTLSKYQTEAVDLWMKYLFQAKLDNQHFNEIRSRIADNTKMNLNDGNNLVKAYFYMVLFGKGSYRNPGQSYPEAITKISPATVQSYYNNYIGLSNARLVVVGDFDDSLFDQMNLQAKTFNRLNKVAPELSKNILPETKPGIFLIDRPLNQGFIRIGQRAIARSSNDYYSFQLANTLLGGTSFSALYNRIRIEEGLTYNILSATPVWDYSGTWFVNFATKLDIVPIAINESIKTVVDIQKSGFSVEKFNKAQDYFDNSWLFKLHNFEDIALYIDYYEELGIGPKGFSIDAAKYKETTLDDVNSVLRKVINPDKFVIVIVGPKDKLLEPLSKMGKVTIID